MPVARITLNWSAALLGCLLSWRLLAEEPRVVPAMDTPPSAEVGAKHYCFQDRKPTRPATFAFNDLAGWTVAQYGHARGALQRTREAQIWSTYVARADVVLAGGSDRVELWPPNPIPLPAEFDCVNVWVRAAEWYCNLSPRVWVSVSFRLRDQSGETHEIRLGSFPWKDWFLAHRRVVRPSHSSPGTVAAGGDGNGLLDAPVTFEAVILNGTTRGKTCSLYFDYVSFYQEQASRTVSPSSSTDVPFPTTPDTILPTCRREYTVSTGEAGTAAMLVYNGDDGVLAYTIEPELAGLGGISARWDDGPSFHPMAGGGPQFPDADVTGRHADTASPRWERLSTGWQGHAYEVRWRMASGTREAEGRTTYRLKGKSLVIDIQAQGPHLAGVDFGHCDGLPKPTLIHVPFLTMRPDDPRVLCSDGLFVSAFVDWYVSNGSQLYGAGSILSHTAARYNGGVRYKPRTDGLRNGLCERIFLTVSPRFEETLPTLPNPPNPYAKQMVDRAWWDVGVARIELIQKMHRWGLRGAMMEYNGVIWEQGTDFTRRSFYADGGINVGADAMAAFGEQVRGLGYLFGLHTNYCIIPPGTHRCWDEHLVSRSSDGEWQTGWGRCYAVKPSRVLELQREYSTLKKQRFGTNCEYIDQATAWLPGRNTDYDAQAPMAAQLRGHFAAYGMLLRRECETIGGPVISEGPHQWFYAGLAAGNYGQLGGRTAYKRHLLVDFDLLKMHTLQCDAGIGIPSMFYGRDNMSVIKAAGVHSDWFDRWVAWTLACGHIAQLTGDWGDAGLVKSYYMVQPAQRHYALVPVTSIRYFDGQQLVDTSEALRRGIEPRSQLRVTYANGLSVWVNGSWTEDWLVAADGRTWLLPPAGFVLLRRGEILEYSALTGSRRVDYVETRDACYLDARGSWTDAGVLATDGAAACFREATEENVLWLVPALAATTIAVRPEHFGMTSDSYRVTAFSVSERLTDVPWHRMGDALAIDVGHDASAYRISPEPRQSPASQRPLPTAAPVDVVLSPRRWLDVPVGSTVPLRVQVFRRADVSGEAHVSLRSKQFDRSVSLSAGDSRSSVFELPVSETGGDLEVTVQCGGDDVEREFRLTLTPVVGTVLDFMDHAQSYAWGYCRRGEPEVTAAAEQGPGYARFRRTTASCAGEGRPAFAAPPVFDRPPHGYVFGEFSTALPTEPVDLCFGVGINETSPSTDGVGFSIQITGESGQRRQLFEVHYGNGPWRDERVPLDEYAGQRVSIRFKADCGPAGDAGGDSARWARPRLVRRRPCVDVALVAADAGSTPGR